MKQKQFLFFLNRTPTFSFTAKSYSRHSRPIRLSISYNISKATVGHSFKRFTKVFKNGGSIQNQACLFRIWTKLLLRDIFVRSWAYSLPSKELCMYKNVPIQLTNHHHEVLSTDVQLYLLPRDCSILLLR